MIYIGADHRGFNLKELVKNWLSEFGFQYQDMGNMMLDPNDDYTKYAEEVAAKVSEEEGGLGILICGSGVGVETVANKFDNVRAAIGKTAEQVGAGRNDDDMNVLVIAADYTAEDEAHEMIRVFLQTKYDKAERHERRLQEIKKVEERN